MLKEFLAPSPLLLDAESTTPYTHQLVASMIKDKPSYTAIPLPESGYGEQLQERFSFGSEWVYFKIYCGRKTADRILREPIAQLVKNLCNKKIIDRWFFIRYQDPEPHLRLRLHLKDARQAGMVAMMANSYFRSFEKSGLIWKTQLDTYVREWNRYGHQVMLLSEDLFCRDSEQTLALLALMEVEEQEELRWAWTVKAIDEFLNCFEQNTAQKIVLLRRLKMSFAHEFNAGKTLRKAISKKYRAATPTLKAVMEQEAQALDQIWQRKNQSIQKLVGEVLALEGEQVLFPNLQSFLANHIHMLVNRMIPNKQRKHEMICYDFLFRYYQSVEAQNKESQPSKRYLLAT